MSLRILELQDEIGDLRKKLEDRDEVLQLSIVYCYPNSIQCCLFLSTQELKTRQDEVLCLSASLLEKEQLLFGAGIHTDDRDDSDAAKVSRDALSRASHNLMLQELEGLKKVYCQVCVYSSSIAASRLVLLSLTSCRCRYRT